MAYEIRLQVMSPEVGVEKAPGEFPPGMGANGREFTERFFLD